ncbi:hypothetical protein PMZ80_000829 [Knufia obscura]|uniref:Major facilitator superfamily (MFS) profile domain-containing protein n=2 Tax=Knufia TaxID=430999 RepID=A0AAN8I1U0_9EURO|nr:hypothetical protein PMZ80_000829 [Knufia obscura]KAK5949907.1 hypothetical protein OHC33_009092 [Knufia fluminis]
MPGAGVVLSDGFNVDRIEAPVTFKAYILCAFAAFGGIFFGYDSGYINGIMGMKYFIQEFGNGSATISSSTKSLIVSILSVGTFLGALVAGDLADSIGRRTTIILGCAIFCVGAALQCASAAPKMLIGGRFVAGIGVGFVSAIIILYMSEVAPRKVRGAIVSAYQFCVTIGIMLASVVTYGTQNYTTSASYRVPIGIQFAWALILGVGLFFLPESPRYHVRHGDLEKASHALSRVRGTPETSSYIKEELAEIVANHEYEMQAVPHTGYFSSWTNCFKGSIRKPDSNLRRTILGTSLQMMQQATGVNFIFYYSTSFFQLLNLGVDPFLLSLITTLINVLSTPISFWTVERFGRRPLLIWGALGMVVCQYLVAILGTVAGGDKTVVKAEIAFVCIYIFFFASTWGPAAWVVIGEVFNLPMRSRGVALSTSSNWLFNFIVALITPQMVDPDKGNLREKVFFV